MTNYLIDFKKDTEQTAIDSYLTGNNCTIIKVFDKMDNTYHVTSAALPPVSSIVLSIIDDDATPLQLLTVVSTAVTSPTGAIETIPNDEKDWWKIYSMKDVDLSVTSTTMPVYGKNTNIYLVDSGITSHPEF